MKLRAIFTTLALGAACMTAEQAHAWGGDPCESYLCMAGMSGQGSEGSGCEAGRQSFFSIIIYDEEGIDFPATRIARQEFLQTCSGSSYMQNSAILNEIIAEWGEVIM
ncbi:hypothetical protein [Dyella sp.]|uniref:hypothetical protein n=1 Tax=Dyella sp. TaxID=1869338 RepID=UPI002ED0DB54